jgi:HEAT repeat protein
MDEVARLQDLRATAPLLKAALDPEEDLEMRRTAIFALGRLGSADARRPLMQMLDDPEREVEPVIRRTTWIALARIGGEEAFAVLQKAFPSPDDADRRAVVQALGAMRHPLAARELANIYVLRGDDSLGLLAYEYLRQQGDLLASPALEPHLSNRNAKIRRQVAFLLGEFQNPTALPELMSMLADDRGRLRVIAMIAGITGLDVTASNDRVAEIRGWYARNANRSQSEWFLQALAGLAVRHSLKPDQFGPDVGTAAVPELTRLVLEAEQPYVRSLAARMLRVNTGEDYGAVGPLTTEAQRVAICERYRFLFDADKAASGR